MSAEVAQFSPEDAVAFGDLIQPLLAQAFDLAFAMVGDREEAEDAVQEAALNAFRKIGQFKDRGLGLRPWFFKIVANQCRSSRRSHWARTLRYAEVPDRAQASHENATDLRLDLARALHRLTPNDRAVLFLYYQLDLAQDEVARILGVRVGTVKSRVNRAVAKLRASLGDEESLP